MLISFWVKPFISSLSPVNKRAFNLKARAKKEKFFISISLQSFKALYKFCSDMNLSLTKFIFFKMPFA